MSFRVATAPIVMKVDNRSRVDKTISKMKIFTALVKGDRKIWTILEVKVVYLKML